jgi:hypothetical protein
VCVCVGGGGRGGVGTEGVFFDGVPVCRSFPQHLTLFIVSVSVSVSGGGPGGGFVGTAIDSSVLERLIFFVSPLFRN